MAHPLILASASPRRRAILAQLGVPFQARSVDVPEQPHPGESPRVLAERLAREKAEAAARLWPDAVIVAADTVVAFEGQPLGKPADASEARDMLRRLRGRTHEVLTGIAVLGPGSQNAPRTQAAEVVTTRVHMREYSDAEIEAYVASGDPLDKAGSYAIQHAGFRPVDRVEGCHLNVVGLSLCATARLLASIGYGLGPQSVPWLICRPDGICEGEAQHPPLEFH